MPEKNSPTSSDEVPPPAPPSWLNTTSRAATTMATATSRARSVRGDRSVSLFCTCLASPGFSFGKGIVVCAALVPGKLAFVPVSRYPVGRAGRPVTTSATRTEEHENSTDVGRARGLGAFQAGSPGGHHRGEQRARARPRRHRRGPDDGGLPLGVRG